MASKRIDVLVYSGNGTTIESVRHCLYSLRRLLSPNYAVLTVSGEAIVNQPWTASCALLVIPGGADMGYCRTLNGEGNRRISQFVERGGAFLGLCAGGYYGSKRCEFEVGDKKMEVVGSRELAFYPGICRGCAFPGFVYHSEVGARSVELKITTAAFAKGSVSEAFRSYYNGGGVFVDAPKYHNKGIEILASYTDKLNVDPGEGAAAVVYCKVGDGAAVLTGPHPEFAAVNLEREKESDAPGYSKVVEALVEDDKQRANFLRACLSKLGLRVNPKEDAVPSLSRLHLSSLKSANTTEILASLQDIITVENGEEHIKDDNDTFHILSQSSSSRGSRIRSSSEEESEETDCNDTSEDRILNYSTIVKSIVIHDEEYPANRDTPYFNHHAYYANLRHYQSQSTEGGIEFGQDLLYGEVVTSTNTILEKNTQILRRLPAGLTATATVQVAGRGRGDNVWVSPAGCLIFSTIVRHSVSLLTRAPVVFLQYIAALAVVEGIKTYDAGYADLPVKLKWPNDISKPATTKDALDPSDPSGKTYSKIGGILVNSHYSSSEYLSVVGIGLNTTNAHPSFCLNSLCSPPHSFSLEKLLA
ncbi:biotin holocarboxylase synthetase, partial [Peltigera leucophlebia]|nr:biotin holocarboxylase synthetase [Peltigera leucophlebia]